MTWKGKLDCRINCLSFISLAVPFQLKQALLKVSDVNWRLSLHPHCRFSFLNFWFLDDCSYLFLDVTQIWYQCELTATPGKMCTKEQWENMSLFLHKTAFLIKSWLNWDVYTNSCLVSCYSGPACQHWLSQISQRESFDLRLFHFALYLIWKIWGMSNLSSLSHAVNFTVNCSCSLLVPSIFIWKIQKDQCFCFCLCTCLCLIFASLNAEATS